MFDLLRELCQTPGISGCEDRIREILAGRVGNGATCETDALGSLIVHKKGAERPKTRLMLCAHMDEVGLIVTNITDAGMLRFEAVGGVDPRVVLGRRLLFAGGVRGVIGTKPVHLMAEDEKKAATAIDILFIDIVALYRGEAEKLVQLGETAVFDSDYVEFGDGFLKARALDDRMGCAILMELVRSELPYDMDFVFSVQ